MHWTIALPRMSDFLMCGFSPDEIVWSTTADACPPLQAKEIAVATQDYTKKREQEEGVDNVCGKSPCTVLEATHIAVATKNYSTKSEREEAFRHVCEKSLCGMGEASQLAVATQESTRKREREEAVRDVCEKNAKRGRPICLVGGDRMHSCVSEPNDKPPFKMHEDGKRNGTNSELGVRAIPSIVIEDIEWQNEESCVVFELLQERVWQVAVEKDEKTVEKVQKLYKKNFAKMRNDDFITVKMRNDVERKIARKNFWHGFLHWYLRMCKQNEDKTIVHGAQIWTWGIQIQSQQDNGYNFNKQLQSIAHKNKEISLERDDCAMVRIACGKFQEAAKWSTTQEEYGMDAEKVWMEYVEQRGGNCMQNLAVAMRMVEKNACNECIAYAAGIKRATLVKKKVFRKCKM